MFLYCLHQIWALKWRRYRSVHAGHWVGGALLLDRASTSNLLLATFPGRLLDRGPRRVVGRLIRAEVRAQIVDQSVVIVGIDDRSPLDHLIDLLRPCAFAEALLQDDARLVTVQAGCGGLGLDASGRLIVGGLPRRRERRRKTKGNTRNGNGNRSSQHACARLLPAIRVQTMRHESSPDRRRCTGSRSDSIPG